MKTMEQRISFPNRRTFTIRHTLMTYSLQETSYENVANTRTCTIQPGEGVAAPARALETLSIQVEHFRTVGLTKTFRAERQCQLIQSDPHRLRPFQQPSRPGCLYLVIEPPGFGICNAQPEL